MITAHGIISQFALASKLIDFILVGRSMMWNRRYTIAIASLCLVSAFKDAVAQDAGNSNDIRAIRGIAAGSACAKHNWNHRGLAPRSYIEGAALVFARAACHPERADVKVVSAPPGGNDALAHYHNTFSKANIRNDVAGVDTLRHSYVLLIGLGMMESSGKYCEGRDVSMCFNDPETAEAGLIQTSYGARKHSSAATELISEYSAGQRGCMLDIFEGHVTCKIRRSHNKRCPNATSDIAGVGPGADWQKLTKACPAFALEYGAVIMRTNGGGRGEFGPIRRRRVEVYPECDNMLKKVQDYVTNKPQACSTL